MRFSIKKFRDWKIKAKLMLLTVVTLVSILILGFTSNFFFNTSRSLSIMMNAKNIHQDLLQDGIKDLCIYKIQQDHKYLESAVGKINRASQIVADLLNLRTDFKNKTNYEIASCHFDRYPEIYNNEFRNAELVINRLKLFISMRTEETQTSRKVSIQVLKLTNNISNKLSNSKANVDLIGVHNQLQEIRSHYAQVGLKLNELVYKINRALIWAMILIALCLGVVIFILANYISKSISMPVKKMVENFKLIAKGNFGTQLTIQTEDEIGALAKSFNIIQNDFQNVVEHTQKVAKGDLSISLPKKSNEDELALSLNQMVENLRESQAKNDRGLWLRSGINQFNEVLRGDQNLQEMSKNALNFITEFTKAELGAIYVYHENKEILSLTASLGLPNKNQFKNIKIGHGLVGQVAETRQIKILKDLPSDYFKVFSGTGEITPNNLILVPLVFNDSLWGVMELASINQFSDSTIDFITSVRESVTIKIATTIARVRLENLLKTTQKQAGELQIQQEELRVANEELAEQTKILTENEKSLQVQQEELRVANEELEERTNQLEIQKEEIEYKNKSLSQAHGKLEGKARELEQASQYKSDFLANMSHELRTPLNSLLILSGMLAKNKEGNLKPDDIKSLEIINKSGQDLLQLINEILDLSKIEAGKMAVQFEQTLPEDVEKEILLSFNHQAKKKKLKFDVKIADDFPKNIETDQIRLLQIIKNLLSNAFKFTSKGTVTVLMEKGSDKIDCWREDLKNVETCAITVTDTGVGIPAEKKEAIFEAFQQADGSTSRKYGGTGLGLSISKELAHMLGGEIHVESEIGEGSSFMLLIPVKQKEKDQQKVTDDSHGQKESTTDVNVEKLAALPLFIDDDRNIPHSNPIVVVVHPNKEGAISLYHQIHENSFHALVASNVEDAILLIEAYQPSAIIIGVELVMTAGEEPLNLLRSHSFASELPIHIVNPVEGIRERNLSDIPTVNATNLTFAVEKIKSQLFAESKKILVVEDDINTRNVIKSLLIPSNVEIKEASTGKEAYETIKTGHYDCVILDLGLPDFTGNELLKKLSEDQVPIPNTIIYTGKELSREEHRELSKYTNSIILKGLKSDERLMDEVTLFLHHITTNTPDKSRVGAIGVDDSIFKGKRVLVVDDEIRNIFALGKILEDKDIEVLEAENGRVAIDILKENKNIDLVLMDIMMPEMDGHEAMNIIRKTPEIQDVPIICLTAKAMKEDYEKAISSGANDYLSKPLDENKLFSMLKIWLYN